MGTGVYSHRRKRFCHRMSICLKMRLKWQSVLLKEDIEFTMQKNFGIKSRNHLSKNLPLYECFYMRSGKDQVRFRDLDNFEQELKKIDKNKEHEDNAFNLRDFQKKKIQEQTEEKVKSKQKSEASATLTFAAFALFIMLL